LSSSPRTIAGRRLNQYERAGFAAGPTGPALLLVWRGLVALLVLKFGGTSVGDIDRIKNVAAHVKREVDAGHACAVVVSAMAGHTNQLVAWVDQAWGFK